MESGANQAGARLRRIPKHFLPQSRSKTAAFGQKTQAAVRIAMDSPWVKTLCNQGGYLWIHQSHCGLKTQTLINCDYC